MAKMPHIWLDEAPPCRTSGEQFCARCGVKRVAVLVQRKNHCGPIHVWQYDNGKGLVRSVPCDAGALVELLKADSRETYKEEPQCEGT